MKQDKKEAVAVEEVEYLIAELADLQLAMVGGGIGDVVFS